MVFKEFTCHLRAVEMGCNRSLHFLLLLRITIQKKKPDLNWKDQKQFSEGWNF